jgi:hypothetical protein
MSLDPVLRQLWLNAIRVSVEQRVPAVCLVEAYMQLINQYGSPGNVPQEAITQIGEDLVREWGPHAFLEGRAS